MSKQIQLFLLPFAGGSADSFRRLDSFLDNRIEVLPVEYPGRGKRRTEPYLTDYRSFLEDATAQINSRRSKLPYAVFGYSMGSALAYDLLSKGLIRGTPSHVFLCARGSICRKQPSQEYASLSDNEFAEKMEALGGIDARILKNKRFRDIYLKPVRADYAIWGQYCFQPGKIPCSATMIYSPKDSAAAGVHDWEALVSGPADYFEMGENHFFILEHWKDAADIINAHLSDRIKNFNYEI